MSYYPVLSPLLSLLKSRKFWTALLTLAFDMVVVAVPTLEPLRVELIGAATLLAVFLMGSIAYEDVGKASKG